MTKLSNPTGHTRLRVLLAAVVVVAVFAGCSSSSTSADKSDDATEQSGNVKGTSKSKADSKRSGDFPDSFPDDVPLPEFTKVQVISSNPVAPQVMLTIDPTLAIPGAQIMKDYSDQLEAAGYEVSGESGGSMEAEGSDRQIHFHSSMDGTLSVAVLQN